MKADSLGETMLLKIAVLVGVVSLVAEITAQPTPPKPEPLTLTYTYHGIWFRYPGNWIVREQGNHLTIAPETAFIVDAGGRSFVTHGFFLWSAPSHFETLGALAERLLTNITRNTPRIQVDTNKLENVGDPIRGSCGDTVDPAPPYTGTEKGRGCVFRVGNLDVVLVFFSPSKDWDRYGSVLDEVAKTLTSAQTPQQSIPIYTPPAVPTYTPPAVGRVPIPRSSGGCQTDHWIESVDSDGKIIKLEDGSLWEVDDVDTVDTAIWLPVSNVVICGSKMINTDDKETAEVTRINPSAGQSSSVKYRYIIQAASNDETFVINSEIFKAKTYCFNIEKGDKVIFVDGSPLGTCVSAKFLDLRNDKVCEAWCE